MVEYVIWGTGKYYQTYKRFLNIPGFQVKALIDSDVEKQGKVMDGIVICAPQNIPKDIESVVIAVKDDFEIRKFLNDNYFRGSIYSIVEFPFICAELYREDILKAIGIENKEYSQNKRTIIFDIMGGCGWAGTEMWAYKAALLLKERGYHVVVLGDLSQPTMEEKYENILYRIDVSRNDMSSFFVYLGQHLPVYYFGNMIDFSREFVVIAKQVFGDNMRLCMVMHLDMPGFYDCFNKFDRYSDYTLCVSSKIERKCIEMIPESSDRISHVLFPCTVSCRCNIEKNCYSPIKIGYAGRLVRFQKRAELLVDFIGMLEDTKCNYIMEIAGEGECLKEIEEYIYSRNLEDHVKCRGRVLSSEMLRFWEDLDIFLNFSLAEGASLSMLDAMSCGCVPVVTDVSGVEDVIENGWNGIVVPVEEWYKLPGEIAKLSHDRDRLKLFGKRSRDKIVEKCNKGLFISKLEEIIGADV